MNTFRNILAVTFFLMLSTFCYAQPETAYPKMEWQSTSSMAGSGTTLPMAAQQGVSTTNDEDNAGGYKPHIRKVNKDDDIGDPGAVPVGEGLMILGFLGVAYALRRRIK